MQNESISLYLKEGRSDKEYHAELLKKDGGFVVNFRYGRRGGPLKVGTKTAQPVSYEDAKKTYDKLVKEKTQKGYSTGEAGALYQDSEYANKFSGILPQLLNEIRTDEELEQFLTDDAYCAQEKFDGERRMLRKGSLSVEGEVHGVNKKGLMVSLPQSLVDHCQKFDAQHFIIDGELVGERLYAFDLLELNGTDLRSLSFKERTQRLNNALGRLAGPIYSVETVVGTKAKRAFLEAVKARKGEGIVFKRIDAPYVSGRPASGGDQIKYKLYATATCRVAGINGSKRSVFLELHDEKGLFHSVGKVSISVDHRIPCIGTQVEVRYLYAYKGGSLYQSTYLGERPDQDIGDASLAQLKYKPEHADEDDEA